MLDTHRKRRRLEQDWNEIGAVKGGVVKTPQVFNQLE